MGSPRGLHLGCEWILRCLQLLQPLPHLGVRAFGETAACLTDADEASAIVVEAEDDRGEVFARSLGVGVTADHAFNHLCDFDLEPLAGALFDVTALPALGDDA